MMIGASLYTIKYLLVIIVMQALKKSHLMCHKKQYQIEKLGNGTLWHFMTYIIWHKMSWTIAIWVSKELYESDKCSYEKIFYTFLFILQCKMQKTNWPHFPLYFWADPFVNLKSKVGTLKLVQSSNFLAFYTSIDQNNGKKSRNWELSNFFDFWTTLPKPAQ